MGVTQSVPSVLTHEKLYELTKDTRGVMNVLLDYMLKEITVRDFLLLSNPQECKKYVMFMANNLYKYFYELKILPTKDKRGVIAFRPVKELTSLPEDVDKEKQSLCLVLAYFYTRIFQIYGALALTLIDDASYMSESGLLSLGESGERGLLPPGYRQYTTFGGAELSSASFGIFNFIKSYLVNEYDDKWGFKTKYSGIDKARGNVYFKTSTIGSISEIKPPLKLSQKSELEFQKATFAIGTLGAKAHSYLDIYARKAEIGIDDIKLQFHVLRYYPGAKTIELGTDIIPDKVITIKKEGDNTYKVTPRSDAESIDVNTYFNDILSKVVMFIQKLSSGKEDSTDISSSGPIPSEVGTAEELRMARIIQNLTKTKPLGHCIARAIQLLRNLPLRGEPGVSYICKAKFFESSAVSGDKTTITRSGIPEPGTSLDNSPGLAALSQLFYDTVVIGSPKLVMSSKPGPGGKPSTLQQYIMFMKKLARLFGDEKMDDDSGTMKSDDKLRSDGLKGLKNKRDKVLCGKLDGDITVPSSVVGSVYGVVNQMFKDQLAHSARCGEIFKELFNLVRDKASGRFLISLNDSIIKNGLPEIERINFKARELLVNYYTNCETKYLMGMKMVLDTKRQIERKEGIFPTRPGTGPIIEGKTPAAAAGAGARRPRMPGAPGSNPTLFDAAKS